jgi:hypothetical protein
MLCDYRVDVVLHVVQENEGRFCLRVRCERGEQLCNLCPQRQLPTFLYRNQPLLLLGG